MMRVLILANGDPPDAGLARRIADEADVCIATDGAVHKAAHLGIAPDVVCGDFDSVDMASVGGIFPRMQVVPTPDQEFADLEKAFLLARERGATEIAILGATGGRIDHTLSSFALLLQYGAGLLMRLLDNQSATWAVSGGQRSNIATTPGETISLVTFGGATVSIQGVEWPLDAFALRPGTHGVSNVAALPDVVVEVTTGSVFVTHFTPVPPAFLKLSS